MLPIAKHLHRTQASYRSERPDRREHDNAMERTADSRHPAGHGRPRSEPTVVEAGEGPGGRSPLAAIFAFWAGSGSKEPGLWMSYPSPGSLRSASQQVVHVPPVTDHLDVAGVDVEDDPVGPASQDHKGGLVPLRFLIRASVGIALYRSIQSLIRSLTDSGRPFRLRRARRVCVRRGRT